MVLRVEQAEGVYALDKRPVEMKPGEGKSLVFIAAAMQRAVHHGECLLVTTTDGLAHREFTKYRRMLTDFGIDVFRADQQQGFGPVTDGRPAVVVATGETVGHLCNAGHRPPRHALIDEMDGIIDRGERQFLRSEGVEQAAPEATAREVFAAHDFLADALAKGVLSHQDFGLTRIIEEVGLYSDGTPEVEFWYDGRAELTPEGRAKVGALPGGKQWLDGLGSSRLEMAAAAEFTTRNKTHYVMDAGKIVIIDQGEHGLQRNPKTSSESRWSAEQGKASLAQAVEAKEIRAAEAIRMSAEQHQIVVRADADSAKTINAVEIYRMGGRPEDRFFDEVTGASGTLADLNPVLEKIYGLEEAHRVNRSREQRLMEGAPEVVANTRAKLSAIAEGAHRVWQGGRGRSQEILCHRNDLVDRQVQALVRQGVPREAIEAVDADRIAGWGADWEAKLQNVFDAAGEQGKILVINRQGQRGVDISVSESVQAKGGMFVWMTEVPEQSYIHEQAKNRTARNGDRGAAQALISPQDALIRKAMHLTGVRAAAIRYEQVAEAHRTDPTPENHNNLVEAGNNLRSLVPGLQERALRHATADFIRHHAYFTNNPAAVLAAAEAFRYQGSTDTGQIGQPDHTPDRAAHLAGLLGIPASAVAGTAAALEQDGAGDPLDRLLDQAGLPPAAVEALRQHVEATAPTTAAQYAGLNNEQALDQLVTQQRRLAGILGWDTKAIEGAEGMRMVDPALTEARNNLAKALGYPASDITPAIARDILGEAVNQHLTAEGAPESAGGDEASRGDAATISANPISVDRVAENAEAGDVIAAASHYLATAALLDLVERIHRRSPNSCVNNAVTGMRVLTGRDIEMPSSTLAGHGRDAVKNVFGAPLENAGSLDGVAESLRARPGGITVLVYKWKDTPATGSANAKATGIAEADDHMVLVVNDSKPGEAPNLVVVDLAASRDGDTGTDYGPKDLRNRRTLLDKAVQFDTWRQKQQKFIDRLAAGKHRFETIDFDVDGNLLGRSYRDAPLPRSHDAEVSAELVQEINSMQPGWPVNGNGTPDLPSRTDTDTPDKSDIFRLAEPARIGSRPHESTAGSTGSRPMADAPGDRQGSWREFTVAIPKLVTADAGRWAAQGNSPDFRWLASQLGPLARHFSTVGEVALRLVGDEPFAELLPLWRRLVELSAEFENAGSGIWHARTMYQLMEWLVDYAPVGEYRNSYEAVDSVNDRGVYVGVSSEVNRAGIMRNTIVAAEGTPRGGMMFADGWDEVGDIVHGIEGFWVQNNKMLGDNLATFNARIREKLSPEDAARATFTGKMACRRGFTEVLIDHTVGDPGYFEKAVVTFVRPSRLWEMRCRLGGRLIGIGLPEMLDRAGWSSEIAYLRDEAALESAEIDRQAFRPSTTEISADWSSRRAKVEIQIAKIEQLAKWVRQWWAEEDARDHSAIAAVAADVVRRNPGAWQLTPNIVLLPGHTVVVIAEDGWHDDAVTDMLLHNLELRSELRSTGYAIRQLKPVVEQDDSGNSRVRSENLGTVHVNAKRRMPDDQDLARHRRDEQVRSRFRTVITDGVHRDISSAAYLRTDWPQRAALVRQRHDLTSQLPGIPARWHNRACRYRHAQEVARLRDSWNNVDEAGRRRLAYLETVGAVLTRADARADRMSGQPEVYLWAFDPDTGYLVLTVGDPDLVPDVDDITDRHIVDSGTVDLLGAEVDRVVDDFASDRQFGPGHRRAVVIFVSSETDSDAEHRRLADLTDITATRAFYHDKVVDSAAAGSALVRLLEGDRRDTVSEMLWLVKYLMPDHPVHLVEATASPDFPVGAPGEEFAARVGADWSAVFDRPEDVATHLAGRPRTFALLAVENPARDYGSGVDLVMVRNDGDDRLVQIDLNQVNPYSVEPGAAARAARTRDWPPFDPSSWVGKWDKGFGIGLGPNGPERQLVDGESTGVRGEDFPDGLIGARPTEGGSGSAYERYRHRTRQDHSVAGNWLSAMFGEPLSTALQPGSPVLLDWATRQVVDRHRLAELLRLDPDELAIDSRVWQVRAQLNARRMLRNPTEHGLYVDERMGWTSIGDAHRHAPGVVHSAAERFAVSRGVLESADRVALLAWRLGCFDELAGQLRADELRSAILRDEPADDAAKARRALADRLESLTAELEVHEDALDAIDTASLQKACNFQGLVWFDVRPGSTSRARLESLLEMAKAELRAAIGRDPAQLSKQELDDYRYLSDDGNTKRWATAFGDLTMIASVTDQAHRHETGLAAVTEQLDNELAQVFGAPPDTPILLGPSSGDVIEHLGQRFPGVRSPAADVLARHVDSTGVERFLMVKEVFRDGGRGVWRLPSALEAMALDLRAAGPSKITEADMVLVDASEQFVAGVADRHITNARWLTRGELEFADANRMVHGWFQENFSAALGAFDPVVTPTDAAAELARSGSRLSLSADDIELRVRRLTGRPAGEHTQIVHFFRMLADEFERNQMLAELNADLGGGDLLDLHLHTQQTQISLAAFPEIVDVISTPMAHSILLDMANSGHWSADTIGAAIEFLARPEISEALQKIDESNSHFEPYVCRRMSKHITVDLDAVGRELRRVAEIPAGAVDLRLLTMFDRFVTKNPPGKDRAWDMLAALDDFSPGSVRRKFANAFLRTRQIANIPDDVRAEVEFTPEQLCAVEDLYIRGPNGPEFACYVETVGQLPVGQRPPAIRAAMEFVREVTPEFARCLRAVLADGADGAERSALGLQRSGETDLAELKDIARSFVAEVKGAGISAESLAKVQSSDFLARLLIDVTHYERSGWGPSDIASLREMLRYHERVTAKGDITPMPGEYRPSGVVEVAKLRTRDGESGPQWTEDLLTRFARLAQNLQVARSTSTFARRPITHLLDNLGHRIAEHIDILEHSIASGRLANGLPMNDVARRNMVARAQDLQELIAPKADGATQFPALRSLKDFENNFQQLSRVGELHDDLRAICFAWAMQKHPEWVDRLQHIGVGEPTLEDITLVREFVEHITNQEVFAQYFAHRQGARTFRRMTSVVALDEAIARTQGVGVSSDTTRLRFVPTRGPLIELSGHIASACWAGAYRSVAEAMPNMTAVIMVRNPDDPARTALAGAGLLIETTSTSGEPLLLIRGLNPLETYINHISVADFYRKFTDWAHGVAAARGRRLAIVIDDHCGGAATNRPALYGYLAEACPELTPIRVNPSDTIFNGYDVSECAYLVGATSTRDQQQHREPGGRIGSRPSENAGDRPDGWMSEPGRSGDVAAADGSADDLLSLASRPLPEEVIGREIDEVTEILGSRVPPEQLADPEVRRGVRLVAEGLYISRRLYGRGDTGRADDIHDAAVELREPGAANRYGDGLRVAADLHRVLDNGVLQGADLGEIMAAMIADAWSDLADGGGRHGGNPQRRAAVRSAELLHARALVHGFAASTARVLGFAVSGIGFDARTGTRTIASPAAMEEMRQRWGEITGGEFETAMRVAGWVAAADLQTLSEPDAVVQWILSDWGNDVGARQALIDCLRDRAGFADPDSGYRPPEGWLLANRDMRRDHAAKAREIADRLASDPGYTPVDANRDSRLHMAEMREKHSGFGWQLVIGPGADASDPGTLAARLPELGSARAREGHIDAIARLAALTLPRAGADAVLVVTSSKEADGRRRLLAELDYTRPDATDPAPGVTAEELRRELSDVDGRIDVDTAAPLPQGQVRHRVRLDLTRQRILVYCTVWGRGRTGLSTVNWALCRGLAAAGHEVIVSAGQIARGSRLSGVKVYGDRDRVSGASRWKRFDAGSDDLPWSVDLVIVHAEDDGPTVALEAQTRYPAARLVSVHHLTPMLWETLNYSPENGRAEIAARIYLARRAHLVTGLGPVLATDALSAAVMAGHGSVHQLQPGLEIAEQPPEPAPGDPAWILLFGRVDDHLKGAAETAEVVQRLRAQGRDVRLVVRGYPRDSVEAAHAKLARLVGDPDAVEVRPFTASRRKLRDDIRAATIVVMPSRAEGFGGVATEAIEQGVPVAVSSSSGVGRFLAELGDYRDLAERFNLVEQPLGAQVPIDNWVAGLGSVLDDLPGAWAAARGLQELLRPYTRENSARMFVHAARNTDPHGRPEIGQSRTQVSFESGSVVARGEEEDYLRILAVADAMETDRTVRAAVLAGAGVVFAPAPDPQPIRLAAADVDEWMFSSLRTVVPQDDSLSRILRAFVATVSDQGFGATTVEDVCHRARISSAAFHHYFRTTGSAFRTAHHEALIDLRNMVDEEVRGAAPDRAARIAVAVNTYVSALAARPATARMLLVEGVALDPPVRADVMAYVTLVIADTVATVRNETTVLTPERRALAAAVHGILADWVATGDAAAVPRLRSGLAALFRNGTTTPAAQSAAEVDIAHLHQQRVVPFEQSKPDERERISTQLIAVTAEQGFTAMSLEEVQRRAGVSAQTYRKLFSDKETGFEAACAAALARLRTASRAAMPDITGGDIRSRFDTAVRAYLTALAEHPDEARVLHLDLRAHGPLHDRHRMMLADHLAAAVDEIDEDTARLLAAAVQGVVTDRIISGRSAEARVGTSDIESERIPTLPDFAPTVTAAVDGLLAEFGETTPPHDGPPDVGSGLIGSRPFEDSPGERGFAGPEFEELVLAGLESGIAERFVVEDARGVRVEEVTFDNGVRVFKETYADPVAALVQVLQTKVAIMMGAPVAHAMLNLEDDSVYRELTPGRPGDSVDVVDPEVLGSDSALRLGLFDAVTGTHRTAREWSVADNEVMGGRSGSDVDATQIGVFASLFVRRIDDRAVWLDHAMPTWDVAAIREQVSHLDTWISNFPMPQGHRAALLDIYGVYLAALAQVERHAVHTFGERVHRAGLDAQAQAKGRLVEVFTLNYPHVTLVGFDHPDVPAHVVEEILGGLDEMFTRFPDRTNIRELRIDYTDWEASSPRTHNYADPTAAGRTLSMRFSLRDAANPAQTVKRGIRFLEFGLNPVGDRPFHHNAVHEFVHAIDAVEGLSKNLQPMLSQTWGRLSNHGLIEESWWTWLTRLPRYAFVNEAKTVLNDAEALAVGFAEADIHGVAAGSPQWAIHEYVTTGRLPPVTPDLEVDLPPHEDHPDSGGPSGLIGSRPYEDDSQSDAARGAWIKALRLERGMTRKQLTQAAGLANSALSTIESGQRKPRIGTFARICRALGLEGEALNDAVRQFYPDIVLDIGVAAHDSLGDWVRAVRHSKGMTQSDLAHAVGVNPVRIRVYENNVEPPRPGLFLRIARALGLEQQALTEAARHFYRGLNLDLDPTAHDPRSPGTWIGALRYDRDMSQPELERTAGIPKTFASRIEGGHTPTSIVFWRICRALRVAPDVLAAAARYFYRDLNLDLDPAAHDPASPGSWFVALRHDRDMPQSEVAKAIGVGSGHLYRIESGRNRPRFAVFRRICDALGVGGELLRAAARHFYSDIHLDIEPAAHDPGLPGSWIAALRNDAGMSGGELARRARMPRDSISQIENQRFRPRLRKFRQLCGALGVGGDVLLEAVERFYERGRFGPSGDRYEVDLFNRYVVTRVGSPEERAVRDEICKRFMWVRNALALRESPDTRDEAGQVAWMGILRAIDNHIPSASFTPQAWASGSRAISRYQLERQFLDLNNRTLRKVRAVRAQIDRMVAAGEALDNTEIARATRLKMADVMLARQMLTLPPVQLDAPIEGTNRPHQEVADPVATAGSSDTDFARMVRAALADMADPDAAARLVMLHLVEGVPLADVAQRVALPVATAVEIFAEAVARLRDTFDSERPGEVTAGEQGPAALTPRAEVAEQDQLTVRSSDPEAGAGGSSGLIGGRPFEDSPGERAFAGPLFEDLILAGLGSGIVERVLVEDAPGVRIELVTCRNGLRVLEETYAAPMEALVQVLQGKVAVIMDAPVAHATSLWDSSTVYRELTPGRPDDSIDVVPQNILDSSSALRLGLFDAVTRTYRTPREWSVSPDGKVMGGRARSEVDATPAGVFAAKFVKRIDGREVWLDHTLPKWAVAHIRERVTNLESWINGLQAPGEYLDELLDIYSGYLAALAQIERHVVPTPSEMPQRAGLDAEARGKARLVETFALKYPHFTMAGFDHPDVTADVVEEILGGLDEMLTRFPNRTNIRELRIDYVGDWEASAITYPIWDPVARGRTKKIVFNLYDAIRPAQIVELGIQDRELGFNPVGDRPFHHAAVHEFIHAMDVHGIEERGRRLSENLPQVLQETWERLRRSGLIDESHRTWLTRLPEYAFTDESKTELNDVEALAVGFAEADIHGVPVGTPQWVIHEYVTTMHPPQITPDLEVDLPPQADPPAPGRPDGLIGSRPHEDDSQTNTASEQDPVPLTPWTTTRAEPDQPAARSGDSKPGEDSPKPGGLIGSRPHEQDEPPRRPVPGQTTPWSQEVIGEPHPDDQLRRQPPHLIPEQPADNTPGLVPLTACESEVLARVRQGMTHNEIAAALDLSVHDVRTHLASVRRKLRNQRAQLVAASRPADPPSPTSVADRFRAAMYAAVTSADQPDPRELLAAASAEQMERAVQGLSPAHLEALRRLRAGANTPVVRSMALIAARRWVTALAAEHDRSQAVLATALTAANPTDLQTALDQLTAAERQLLVNRFGPATSPATFEPDDSVRALRAVDVVRHVAGRIATRAGMSDVDETGYDKSGLQREHHLVENETYTADEYLDAVVDWMDRHAESGKRSRGSGRGSSSTTADRPAGQLQQDRPPADQAGGGGPITPGGSHPATASSEESGRPDDNNGIGSVRADADNRWRSLPVDHGFDDEQRRLADEALRAGGFDAAGRLQRWGYRLTAGSARRRATENGEWWDSLSDPAAPGGSSSLQRALIQVYPHQIGNADGIPATVRDHANRLSIRRDLDEFIARKPADRRLLNWLRTDLTDAERKQFSNLIHTRNHLQELDRQAAKMRGGPPVHLLSYDATAFHGKGKVVAALGNVDTAHTVNWHVPGTNTTSSSLAYQFKPLRNLYEETLRVDPSLELASIIWIGYDAPAGPVNTGYVKAAFRRRARVGGHRLLCDITALHATRSRAGTAGADRLVTRLYGHSYGSVVIFYAGSEGKLAYLVVTITVSGSPGAGPVRHAAEFGIGADSILIAASWRDLVTMLGADEPGPQSRFNSRLGHGVDPASEAFGGKRFPAEFPDSMDFAGVEAVHQGYLRYDPATGQPTEALANIAQITAGRGDTLASVDRRQPGRGVVARPIDSERGRYADGNEPYPRSTPSSDGPPKTTPWTRQK
ncbi:helix-turn-helix domain-containing protein [Nocardia sp. NPDC004278]